MLSVPWQVSKNLAHVERTIPLNTPQVLWALKWLLDRAHGLGARELQHYLFPSRIGPDNWNPEAPMSDSGIKRQWNEVRQASGLPWLRQYDCRHTAITRYAEAGTPVGIIMDLAGHISMKMTRHYTHISEATKMKAMQYVQARSCSSYQSAPMSFPGQSQPVDPAALIGQLLQQCGLDGSSN